MKITVIGPTFPYKGGISHFTSIMVNNLRKSHAVLLLSWKRQYPSFLYPVEQKDTTSKQQIKSNAKFILDFYNPFSWVWAAWLVRRDKSDKAILTWVTPVQAPIYIVIALVLRLITNSKIVFLCHNAMPHEKKFYDALLTKITFAFGHEFIAHSSEDQEIIRGIVGNKKVIKAFLPIFNEFNTGEKYDTESIKLELGLRNKVLLFFGFVRPYKGLQFLLEAMSLIKRSHADLSLLVVGEFWQGNKPEYDNIVDKLDIKKDVVFIDRYVSNEEVGKYFSIADVVVCPYVTATQSGIIQTAYAFDKPVISTAVGGLKDVVMEGRSGFLLPDLTPASILHCVNRIYDHNDIDMSDVSAEFSWDRYVNKILFSS